MAPIHRFLKKPFFGRYQTKWHWPQDIPQEDWQRISFLSASGANLSALLAEAFSQPARGALVLAHPMGRAAKGFWLKHGHAHLFRQAGYHVLAFDFNGFGESPSTTFEYPADVLAAGHYLSQYFPDLPLAVVGASFGAGYALCALSNPDHPFQAAIFEGAFPTLPDFWQHYPFLQFLLKLSQLVYPALEGSLRPIEAAAQLKNHPQILLIYGEADRFTPPAHGHRLYEVLQHHTDVKLWLVEGVTHTLAYQEKPALYQREVLEFLETSFSPPPPRA
jgi:pimeloyl-ACP methyl ester carboxylesterase